MNVLWIWPIYNYVLIIIYHDVQTICKFHLDYGIRLQVEVELQFFAAFSSDVMVFFARTTALATIGVVLQAMRTCERCCRHIPSS